MDANNGMLVKTNNLEALAFKWTGNRVDFIKSPDWLRVLVQDWEFEEQYDFGSKYTLKILYTGTSRNWVKVNPRDYIILIGELLTVLNEEAFTAIFLGPVQDYSEQV